MNKVNKKSKRKYVSYHQASGLYQARYTIKNPDGSTKRQAVYGKTPEEARDKRDKAIAEAKLGTPLRTSNLTVEEYLNHWISTVPKIRQSTRYNYAGEIRKHIVPIIGHIKLSSLSIDQVQAMMSKLQASGVSVRTTYIIKSIMSKALKRAEAENRVRKDIMKYIELDTYKPKEREIWTQDEAQRFLDITKNHKYHFLFLLYMTYGLRKGEAIPLTWDDVDLEKGVIHINKQYTYQGRETEVCPPKTSESVRDLPIVPHIEQELLRLKSQINGHGSKLLVSNNGEYVNPSSIDYEFKKIIRKNNLRKVALHSLRHFVATMLKDEGATIKDAQKILGHSSPLTTMKYYQHSSIDNMKNALSKCSASMHF